MTRKWLAPEVVQSSAMDCGPAALKSLLEGFGIHASYGRLREACQTDLDGSSIDALEETAVKLGLDATQSMAPADHLLVPEAALLPALAVVRLPNGATHFVVVWRRIGPLVLVMDPGTGRRWMSVKRLLTELYLHTQSIPAEAWLGWTASTGFRKTIARRIEALGFHGDERIFQTEDWRPVAALDAAIRMAESLVSSGAISRGAEARRLVEKLAASPGQIPEAYWSVRADPSSQVPGTAELGPLEPGMPEPGAPEPRTLGSGRLESGSPESGAPEPGTLEPGTLESGMPELGTLGAGTLESGMPEPGTLGAGTLESGTRESETPELGTPELGTPELGTPENVLFRAAVFIQASGRSKESPAALSDELGAALSEAPVRPGLELWRIAARDSRWISLLATMALAATTAGGLVVTILFRSLFDLGSDLRVAHQRWFAAAAVSTLLAALCAFECGIGALVARIGRGLEVRLRLEFLRKIGRLGDRYFRSRLTSDMAERAHLLARLRDVPSLMAAFLRPAFEIAFMVMAIAWLYPASALLAAIAALLAAGIPLAAQPMLSALDLRWRSHLGALSRFHLDALLGWTAIRAHGAEGSMRREHGGLLGEWARAGLEMQGAVALVGALQLAATLSLAAWIILARAGAEQDAGALLLLVYWVLRLPAAGQELAAAASQYPSRRNIALRLLEPLSAPEEPATKRAGSGALSESVSLRFENVTVRAGGHTVLQDVDLTVEAGEHVGVVGASGAGKSSLVGLLLGWHVPAQGRVLVDGAPIDVEALRQRTAWVDPEVRLWNRSLLDNLRYGSDSGDWEACMEAAELRSVVGRLPKGAQSALGEGGALVSGGEGQRVRLGRAFLRSGVRLALLDEPARSLDHTTRRRVMAQARKTWRKQTLLAVTHDVADTLDLPRVVVMEGGRIVEQGDPQQLAADPQSRYRAMLDAEEAVRRGLWASPRWCRLRLAEGKLIVVEPGADRPVAEVA